MITSTTNNWNIDQLPLYCTLLEYRNLLISFLWITTEFALFLDSLLAFKFIIKVHDSIPLNSLKL